MILKDYHVHLEQGPYNITWLEEFLKTADKLGIVEVGFSEHGHRFKETRGLLNSSGFRGRWVHNEATEKISDYIELINEAKARGYKVKLGIELDFTPEFQEDIKDFAYSYPFDYIIGSVHWLGDFGFDHPDLIDLWKEKDIDNIYEEYFYILIKAVESGIFDAIAHPDVIKVFGYKPKKNMSFLYEKFTKALAQNHLIAEVSTAGLRKPVEEMYPNKELMKLFYHYNIPLMLNSDAHRPEDVGKDFPIAINYIRKFGYSSLKYPNKEK